MSALDHLKTPLAPALQAFAKGKADDRQFMVGKSYPCTVSEVVSSGIVTVNFEVNSAPFTLPKVTVPILYPEYIRYPIRAGDRGMVVSASVRLGGLSGLGSGVPGLTPPGNLSAMAFLWLGSTAWSDPTDPDAVEIYGPNGVILRDTESTCTVTLTPAGVVIGGTNGDLAVLGNLSAGNGYTGAVPTGTGQTMMFQDGILTNIF